MVLGMIDSPSSAVILDEDLEGKSGVLLPGMLLLLVQRFMASLGELLLLLLLSGDEEGLSEGVVLGSLLWLPSSARGGGKMVNVGGLPLPLPLLAPPSLFTGILASDEVISGSIAEDVSVPILPLLLPPAAGGGGVCRGDRPNLLVLPRLLPIVVVTITASLGSREEAVVKSIGCVSGIRGLLLSLFGVSTFGDVLGEGVVEDGLEEEGGGGVVFFLGDGRGEGVVVLEG